MSEIKRTYSCPFGHTCEKVVGDTIETCHLYISISGENPQTGEQMDQKGCSLAWAPIIMLEGNKEMRGAAASVQSLRNELTKRIDRAMTGVLPHETGIEHN